MYVAYVALVAIANLFIGFMLATILGDPREIVSGTSRDDRNDCETGVADAPHINSTERKPAPGDAAIRNEHTAADNGLDNSRSAQHSDGTWTEITSAITDRVASFEASLTSLAMRLDEANGTLAEDDANKLKQLAVDETTKWLSEAEHVVTNLSAALKSVPNGKSIASQCERVMNDQLAQSETSFSNLTMIDLASGSSAETARFSQEVKRLIESSAELRSKLNKVVSVAYQS